MTTVAYTRVAEYSLAVAHRNRGTMAGVLPTRPSRYAPEAAMNFVPAFGPQFDGFIAAVLMIFSSVCLLAFLPSIITGVLCARAMA